MSEICEEDNEISELISLLDKSADSTLILNLISPYLIGERKSKLSKMNQDLLEIIRILVINQMKMQNDFRTLLMYLNKKDLLVTSDNEAPVLKNVFPENMYM